MITLGKKLSKNKKIRKIQISGIVEELAEVLEKYNMSIRAEWIPAYGLTHSDIHVSIRIDDHTIDNLQVDEILDEATLTKWLSKHEPVGS